MLHAKYFHSLWRQKIFCWHDNKNILQTYRIIFSVTIHSHKKAAWSPHCHGTETCSQLALPLKWKCWNLPQHVEEEISVWVVGEKEEASGQQCPSPTHGLTMLSQRNHSFWDCLVVITLQMVDWAKIIGLLLPMGSAPLFWSPVLSIQPHSHFWLLLACGLLLVFRLWTHKWWNWLLAQVQDGDVGVVESHVPQIRHCQDRHSLHPRQIPPWKQLLLTAAPTLLVVVDLSPWCHLPRWPCDISREREQGEMPV